MPIEALLMSRRPAMPTRRRAKRGASSTKRENFAVAGNQIMRRHLTGRITQPRQRRFGISHVGIVQDQHGDIGAAAAH